MPSERLLPARLCLPQKDLDMEIPWLDKPVIRRFPRLGLQVAGELEVEVTDKHWDQFRHFQKRNVTPDAGS
jgi:hypothetical protein